MFGISSTVVMGGCLEVIRNGEHNYSSSSQNMYAWVLSQLLKQFLETWSVCIFFFFNL